MRLKSFEAHGFKSFADKVSLTFENGITAIVGPNGSGKSNISDAIRWVMGEQSVKYLRGSKMEDIIFNGSGARRALGMAEVNLVFDNSDHALHLDFDEVSIRRRVFRSGDSEYYINNKPCRLKDILTLLADTGLGRGSMSIIGQNRIDEILNSRPEDRRALFEEAAGIAKYRMRKKEALRKLDDTGNNLIRINDIKSEIEGRIEPLRLASETTEKYLTMADSLRKVQVTQFVHRIENISVAKDKLAHKQEELSVQYNALSTVVSQKEAVGLELKLQLDKLNEEYNALQNLLAEKENNIEKLHGQEAVLGERISQSEKNIERLALQKNKLENQLAQTEAVLQEVGNRYDALDRDRQSAQQAVDTCSTEKAAIEEHIAVIETELSTFKSSVFESMQKIIDLRNDIRGLDTLQDQRMRRREQLKHDIEQAQDAYEAIAAKYTDLGNEAAAVERNTVLATEQNKRVEEQKIVAKATLSERYNRRNVLNREMEKLAARLNVLDNMEKEHEGYGRGVKTLLNTHEKWSQKLVGVVADLFKVPDKYVTAVEVALGAAMQNLITVDAQTAKNAINYLKDNKCGRATFLPLDNIRIRDFTDKDKKAASTAGILGWASDFVSAADNVQKAVKFLLGKVLLAENMDAALAAAKAADFRVRIVTLEGDVVSAGGSMSGGQRQVGNMSFLSRKQEIDRIEKIITGKNTELLQAQESIEEQESVLHNLEAKQNEYKEVLQKNAVRRAELVAFMDRSSNEKAQQAENIELLGQERRGINEELAQAREQLSNLKPQLLLLEQEDAAGKERADKLQHDLESSNAKQTAINARYQDAMIALEGAKERTGVLAERMKQIDEDVARFTAEIEENETESNKTQDLIVQTKTDQGSLVTQQQQLLEELRNTGAGKDEFLTQRHEMALKQEQAQETLDEAKLEAARAQDKLNKAQMDSVRIQTEYEGALNEMSNTHKLTPEEARTTGIVLELSDTALGKEERSLQRSIESLGPINMGAIEEYKAVSERYEFLNKQYNDLCEAKQQLEGVISGINTDMSKRYIEAFAKINEYFQKCYTTLFGGGMAKLEIQNESDMLESGVEIFAQPPGKKLQHLGLLSGGERALTVIALLFALLSYQPAPFCILDEIDAPLDEANIGRFANFLRNYAENTQFIIITHRKGTMEAANVLHGVTMQESGVSKLLSVKLADINEDMKG